MPATACCIMIYVPGDLFSVNPTTARGVPGCLRNERVVCVFDSATAPLLTLVGATIVGSMATVWHGVVNPPRPGICGNRPMTTVRSRCARVRRWDAFLLGSPWNCCFLGPMAFNPAWQPIAAHSHGRVDVYLKITVLWPLRSTRCSLCHLTARAST